MKTILIIFYSNLVGFILYHSVMFLAGISIDGWYFYPLIFVALLILNFLLLTPYVFLFKNNISEEFRNKSLDTKLWSYKNNLIEFRYRFSLFPSRLAIILWMLHLIYKLWVSFDVCGFWGYFVLVTYSIISLIYFISLSQNIKKAFFMS